MMHGDGGGARPDSLLVHFDRLCVPLERRERVPQPYVRRRIAGIHLDRHAVLLGGLCAAAQHRKRRSVPRAERHVLVAVSHRVLVALHGQRPVCAADHGQYVPHSRERRDMAWIDGGGLLVPLDGLFGAVRLHHEARHADKGQDVARVPLCRLPVGRLGLGHSAQARERLSRAHQNPRVASSLAVFRPNLPADFKGALGRPAGIAGAPRRLHYGRLHEEGQHAVLWHVRQGRLHDLADDPHCPLRVDFDYAERMYQVVAQVEGPDNLRPQLGQAPFQGRKIALGGHVVDRVDVLEPPPERAKAGPAHPDLLALAPDLCGVVGRAAGLPVELLL